MGKAKDPEIKALKTILDVLSDLEPPTCDRILKYVASWLDDQLGSEADRASDDAPPQDFL